jgi:hypothetical protein
MIMRQIDKACYHGKVVELEAWRLKLPERGFLEALV